MFSRQPITSRKRLLKPGNVSVYQVPRLVSALGPTTASPGVLPGGPEPKSLAGLGVLPPETSVRVQLAQLAADETAEATSASSGLGLVKSTMTQYPKKCAGPIPDLATHRQRRVLEPV